MKYHKPSFFDQFKCIGSACTDTCCAGWEIEVDETTAQGYLAEKGAFGDRLRREIGSEPGEYFFKLKNNRCPFLNKENTFFSLQGISDQFHYNYFNNFFFA